MNRLPPVKPLTATEQYEQTYERANQIDYPLPPMLLTQLKSFGLNEIRRKNRHLTGSDNPPVFDPLAKYNPKHVQYRLQ